MSETYWFELQEYNFSDCYNQYLILRPTNDDDYVNIPARYMLKLHPFEMPGINIGAYLKDGDIILVFKKWNEYHVCRPTHNGWQHYIAMTVNCT